MQNEIDQVIAGRVLDLGGFSVRRVLPYAQRRMVGPFIFLDHMGPHVFNKGFGLDVNPHPHIGLSTLTYLLEGRMQHRDSLGNESTVHAGEVHWMTAGHGVAHSERSLELDRQDEHRLHGLQIWVALPIEQEDRDPSFMHIDGRTLPRLKLGDVECTLVAGTVHGKVAPVPVYSPLFLIEANFLPGGRLTFDPDGQESALYVVNGSIQIEDQAYTNGQMVVFKAGASLDVTANSTTRVVILGGEAFAQKRHIWWNFVSSSSEKIEQAKARWDADQFPAVVNESRFSRIPLPQS